MGQEALRWQGPKEYGGTLTAPATSPLFYFSPHLSTSLQIPVSDGLAGLVLCLTPSPTPTLVCFSLMAETGNPDKLPVSHGICHLVAESYWTNFLNTFCSSLLPPHCLTFGPFFFSLSYRKHLLSGIPVPIPLPLPYHVLTLPKILSQASPLPKAKILSLYLSTMICLLSSSPASSLFTSWIHHMHPLTCMYS